MTLYEWVLSLLDRPPVHKPKLAKLLSETEPPKEV
jgi:uncharacterized protein (DUF1778 family)